MSDTELRALRTDLVDLRIRLREARLESRLADKYEPVEPLEPIAGLAE